MELPRTRYILPGRILTRNYGELWWERTLHLEGMVDTVSQFSTEVDKIVLCACEMVEHVLPIFEEVFPNDTRPRIAIQTAREYTQEDYTGDLSVLKSAAESALEASTFVANMSLLADIRKQRYLKFKAAAFAAKAAANCPHVHFDPAIITHLLVIIKRCYGANHSDFNKKLFLNIVCKHIPQVPFGK